VNTASVRSASLPTALESNFSVPLLPGLDGPGVKGFLRGTHRTIPPESTLENLRGSRAAMGITRVANVTGLDRIGIPVALAFRPNSRSLAVSQGKGLSLEAAKASALMESVESYHAENIVLPVLFGSYEDLKSSCRFAEIDELPLAGDSRYHPRLPLLWMEGYDLLQRESICVPFQLVSMNYTVPSMPGAGCFQVNSNGLASGNHLLEAISHGICEVVERDALTLWNCESVERRTETQVALETVDDEDCRKTLEKYIRAGVAVDVWEITSDVGIPTFRCSIHERTPDPLHYGYPALGMGSHPSRPIALLRALTEAAQSRLTYVAGSRDDTFREDYARARNGNRSLGGTGEVNPDAGRRRFSDGLHWEGESFESDVAWELERLRSAGIKRVIVVDLTKPEFRLPVVRVIVPGLEGAFFAHDYAPGARGRSRMKEPG
jgi:YcaO-like protein with predicted kinase domain